MRFRSLVPPMLTLGLLVVGGLAPGVAVGGFTIRDLGVIPVSMPGSNTPLFSDATGVNSSGWTSGVSGQFTSFGTTSSSQAVESSGGTFQGVATPPNSGSSFANAINNAGSVAGGFVDTADHNVTHAFYTSSVGKAVDLGTLDSGSLRGGDAQANGINAGNQVVGTGYLSNGTQQAFRNSGGSLMAISTFVPGGFSMGNGINDAGVVIGSAQYSGQTVHAFLADANGLVTDLAVRNSSVGFGSSTYGMAINNANYAVGYGDVNGNEHAFLAPPTGPMVDLGSIDGKASSYAYGLNSQHQVVGKLDDNGVGGAAFLWDPSQGMINLASLLSPSNQAHWQLTSASGINDSDQISGQGYFNGQLHGYLLTPVSGQPLFSPDTGVVPEPSSILLLSFGAALAGVFARFRRGRTLARAIA